MAKNFVSVLLVLISVMGSAPAMAGQNGFGDVMAATSYFPTRNLAAFGTDDSDALVASAGTDATAPDSAAALSAITPAAGDAVMHTEMYGPFQPGKEPVTH